MKQHLRSRPGLGRWILFSWLAHGLRLGGKMTLLLALSWHAPHAVAAAVKPEILLLDMTINGQTLPDVARVEQSLKALLLSAETWNAAHLAPLARSSVLSDGSLGYALDSIAGVQYQINRKQLSMHVTLPSSAFLHATLEHIETEAAPPPRPQPGLMLNYDFLIERKPNGGYPTTSGTVEAIAFSGWGNLVNSALLHDNGMVRSAIRLDTYWRYDMPQRLETLVLGDTVGSGGGWSQPVRYAGIHWGRDFGMRPGFVTLPHVSLAGEAALPSTVELLVNNARRLSEQVAPGPFALNNVPLVSGAGELNLVVRDLLGRETLIRQSYYSSPRLLAPGLSDFSFESGWLRSNYGIDNRYRTPFGTATWRTGLSPQLTGEARLEVQGLRRAGGVELAGLVGSWAVGRVALAASSGSSQGFAEHGNLLQIGLERSTPRGGGALRYEQASAGYAPLGEALGRGAAEQRGRQRWLFNVGAPLLDLASGGFSFVRQLSWDGALVQAASLSASIGLWRGANLSLSFNKRFDQTRTSSTGLMLTWPLGGGLDLAARTERTPGGQLTGAASLTSNPPSGPGLGWRIDTYSQPSQRVNAAFQANTSNAEWTLDLASDAAANLSTRVGGRGTVGWLAGMPFASRPVGQGSFAVVEVEGLAGVPIKRSFQVVAETNARGLAFVPGLLPWQNNQLEIDPVDLPLDVEVGSVMQEVTPYAGSGLVVKFAVRRTRQALLILQQAKGEAVPVGAKVRLLPSGPTFITGRRGEVWLTDLTPLHQAIQVNWPGGACQLDIALPAVTSGLDKIGPLACERK